MSLNDRDLGVAKGADAYGGIANPTPRSKLATNFVEDPTAEGLGAGPNFQARQNSRDVAGVIEGQPGIIESTHIDPLREDTSQRDQWEDVGTTSTGAVDPSSKSGLMGVAIDLGNATSSMLTGAMKMAYGSVSGNEEAFKAGKEAVYGKGA